MLGVVLSLIALLCSGCLQLAGGRPMTPAEHCGFRQPRSQSADMVELTAWARAYGHYCWRAFTPALAAAEVTDYQVYVTSQAFETLDTPYTEAFVQAAKAGTAPDIVFVPQRWALVGWAEAGYIMPFDTCLHRYPEFEALRNGLDLHYRWQGKSWGAPLELEFFFLYFSKIKLRELSWTDAQIDQLSIRIQQGEFTLNDMLVTARQAVEQGVVPPGFGYWPNVRKERTFRTTYMAHGGELLNYGSDQISIDQAILTDVFAFYRQAMATEITLPQFAAPGFDKWSNRAVWRDAVANDRVLFWTAYNYDWANWRVIENWDEAEMAERIGYAPFPNAHAGKPPVAFWNNTSFYAISSPTATGRNRQNEACAIIAKTLLPRFNRQMVAKAGYLSALSSSALHPEQTSRFVRESDAMWNYRVSEPSRSPIHGEYAQIDEFLRAAERGDVTPEAAAAAAVEQLRTHFGDALVVVESGREE